MASTAPHDPAPTDWRTHWRLVREHATVPQPVPVVGGRLALVRYGLAQPFLGLRTILRSRDLLGISLAPVVGIAVIATLAAAASFERLGTWPAIAAFFGTVVALAPVPPLLLGRVYAHLAAKARPQLGLAPHAPYLRGFMHLLGEWIAQLIVLALGVAPYAALAGWVPWAGAWLALLLQAAWVLHWVVVEGLDNARTLPPGCTVAAMEIEALRRTGSPWFQRWHDQVQGPGWLRVLLAPLRMLGEIVASLARPWRIEVDLVEARPWISLGFGLGAAAMLAVPGLNLLLRPAVVVAGVHLRHRLIDEPVWIAAMPAVHPVTPAPSPSRGGTQPHPTVAGAPGPSVPPSRAGS